MTNNLDRALEMWDVASLDLMWNLMDVPANLSPTANLTGDMAASVARARAEVNKLRQERRDLLAATDVARLPILETRPPVRGQRAVGNR